MSITKRVKGIYGEDVAVILGVNNNASLLNLYNKIMDAQSNDENEEQDYWNRTLEEMIAKEFCLKTNKEIQSLNEVYQYNKQFPFIVSDINRRIEGENSILYCKVIKKWEESEWEGDQIPPKEFFKAQHDMAITNSDICYIAALIDDKKFIFRTISRDYEMIKIIVDSEKRFWNTYIQKNNPPKE